MTSDNYDIAIIGGGLIGLTQALKLARADFNVLCLDATKGHQASDDRTTAISYGSSKILEAIDIWDELLPHTCPIKDIQILDGKSSTLLNFQSKDAFDDDEENAFGWIIENNILKQVLFDEINRSKNITFIQGARLSNIVTKDDGATLTTEDEKIYHCQLIIGADGRRSFVRNFFDIPTREWNYDQTALVCLIDHENSHDNIAIEHFRNDGPFAVLPMADRKDIHRSSIVWSFHSKEGDWQSNAWKNNLNLLRTALQERLPNFYGQIIDLSAVQFYPLTFNHAYRYIDNRVVLIGDAAHGIHPIAGQGLNLGLRDVKELSEALIASDDIASQTTLEKYNSSRYPDTVSMSAATDLLNRLFSNNSKVIGKVRKLGLKTVAHSKITKLFFMKQAMGNKGN